MKGKLFVVEGCDGSGKATQTNMLYKRLIEEKYNVCKIEFPDYKSESSSLIKMYLKGDFGNNPRDVNPYAASAFYAVDRFASYKKKWGKFYNNGGIVIADRYTTANMVHQASKISDEAEKGRFLDWLLDFEFNKFELPVPNCVIFLDMPPQYSNMLIKDRNNKFTGKEQKDIHEKNYDYMKESYENSCYIAQKYGWNRICCVDKGCVKTVENIHNEIYDTIRNYI